MAVHRYVDSLPDLITPAEYPEHPEGRLVRVRITVDEAGVHVVADAFRPLQAERVLDAVSDAPIDQMLCG